MKLSLGKLLRWMSEQRVGLALGIIIAVKLCLGGLFSSDYQNRLFMRFVDGFLNQLTQGHLVDPYQLFADEPTLFPYPPGMLLVASVGGLLARMGGGSLFFTNMLFKVPTLFFDCIGLYYLDKIFPGRRRWCIGMYFASPVIVYACYMHGQLDIVPTALLMAALYHLIQRSPQHSVWFVLCLSAAVLCKFHILAVVPVVLLYIQKKAGWEKTFWLTAAIALTVVVGLLPVVSQAFVHNVVFNSEQAVLSKIMFDYGSVGIYLPILALILVYLRVFTTTKINRDLLFSYCGLLYSIFLCLIPPMPGWYVWVIPFICIFFVNMQTTRLYDMAVFGMFNITYLVYFMIAHKSGLVNLYWLTTPLTQFESVSPVFRNAVFTMLIASLIWTVLSMYRSGVASNRFYKKHNLPFTIGIAGDSGSGKSSLLHMIGTIVGERRLLAIEGDGDHKWERCNAMWEHFTHLNPKANYLYRQARDIEVLRSGQSIWRRDYDHATGRFTHQIRISPRPYIVLCGLHSFYLPQVRNMLDLKIYMDINETLRRYWKIQRDKRNRGYSREKVLEQIERRLPDAEHYVYPQKKYADLLVTYYDKDLQDCLSEDHQVSLSLKVTIDISVNTEPLIQEIEEMGINVRYDYDENLERQTLYFEGDNLEKKRFLLSDVAEKIVPQVDELAILPLAPTDALHGILEVLVLMLISHKLRRGGVIFLVYVSVKKTM